ncbi:MAG: sugar-binding transcriptional regulator [Spirochaetales bacterium]|uniref:Sugar-binding transcriptional regulator n=1 Tax=Candidatus Thalassospirochaeta sargassi TaxID=3119039 RepID=A0AAJ1ICJ3_9SPIO|nr:sugar-binding transcriptional regulator [Spirochaetales bacterium]
MQRSRDFLVELARRYYIDEISQQEIAREYNLSRPTVSNILKQCREEGIVEIRIRESSAFSRGLSDRLRDRFGIREAVIVPSNEDSAAVLSRAGAEAAAFASSAIKDGMKVGVAWGTSLFQMVHQMKHLNVVDIEVVQLMGGLGASNPQYDGADLARELSKLLNARYYPLQCPVLVKNIEVKEMLIAENGIRETLQRTSDLDIAFVGLSSNDPDKSALVKAGFLSYDEAEDTLRAGAVGHMCGYSYGAEGNMLALPVNYRIIGIEFDNFLNIPERVGIACGAEKADAIKAALTGGLITTLITDETAALRILS